MSDKTVDEIVNSSLSPDEKLEKLTELKCESEIIKLIEEDSSLCDDSDFLYDILKDGLYEVARYLLDNKSPDVYYTLNQLLFEEGQSAQVSFLIQNQIELNPNGINSYGNTPLRSALEGGSDDDIIRLVQLGADPRVNAMLYPDSILEKIRSIFGQEFEYPANSDKAIPFRKTPNIRVAQELIGLNKEWSYVELYEFPSSRSYESGFHSRFVMTEINYEKIENMIEEVLSGERRDLSEFDNKKDIIGFYSNHHGEGFYMTAKDIFSASPCADCLADYEYGESRMFWLVSQGGRYNENSRMRFYTE